MPPPFCDTNRWFCVASKAIAKKARFRHLRYASSCRLVQPALFDVTKRLSVAWAQDRGLGNQMKKSKKYGPGTTKYVNLTQHK